jgi:hypothetical protein
MAEIKDGVYAQVSGTVGRTNDGRFTIEVKNERSQYPDYVTVWKLAEPVAQGDRIAVKGWLSWKKSERNGKTYVDVSVNQPQLVSHEPATAAAQDWGNAGEPF